MVKQLRVFWLLTMACTLASAQSILSGKVTDAMNHEPLPFVNVLLSKNGVPKLGIQSDFDGQYRLVAMEAGIYDIEFSLISYHKCFRQQVHLIDNQSISLDIELKDDTAAAYSIRVGKIPMVHVSNTSILMGRVTMNREPLSAVNVVLLQYGIPVAREMTDVDGLYRMTDLNAGNYDIDFSQIGCQTKRVLNIKLIDNQCFTAHLEMKEDSTFHADFDLGPKWNVKPLDSLQLLKPLDLPKSIKFSCGVTSGGHSALFYQKIISVKTVTF
jgi:CarboxypepD_reg-like domain